MKSIKPGRGPSMFSFAGSIIGCIFGFVWICFAVRIGAPVFFPLFGILFVGIGAFSAWYNYHNATSENRFSEYDITENGEETDPFEERIKRNPKQTNAKCYCPYCGEPTEDTHKFCPSCGAKL